jgi:hypothetical protein
MRTHILIAAALALSATTVHAAPRSLSAPQSNPVQIAPEAAKPADTPVVKVQSSDEAKPNARPQPAPPAACISAACSGSTRRRSRRPRHGAIRRDEVCGDTSCTGGKTCATGPA